MALAILAIEEHSKVDVLRGIVGHNDALLLKNGWEAYRNHHKKLKGWNIPAALALGAKTHMDIQQFLKKNAGDVKAIDTLKQDCLYTSCWGGGFVEPENLIMKEHVEAFVVWAQSSVASKREVVRVQTHNQ